MRSAPNVAILALLLIFTIEEVRAIGPHTVTVNRALPITGRFIFTVISDSDKMIMSADMSSGKVSVLIDGPKEDWGAVIHPNGEELIFVSNRDGTPALYRSEWDGAKATRVSEGKTPLDNPDWMPSEKVRQVVYYREDEGPSLTNLYLFDLDTNKETKLTTFDGRNSTPKVSPNGNLIAFSTNRFWPGWDVCIYSLSQKSEQCPLKGLDSYCRPTWSLDGKRLAYSVGAGNSIGIGEYELTSNHKITLPSLRGKTYDALYADDGKLVFANNQSGTFNLYFQSEKGALALVESAYDVRYPSWHKNSVMQQEVLRLKSQSQQGSTPQEEKKAQ